MIDTLLTLMANILPIELREKGTPKAAYKRAWKVASRNGDWSDLTMINALKDESVPGSYTADSIQAKYPQLFELWRDRTRPRIARRMLRK